MILTRRAFLAQSALGAAAMAASDASLDSGLSSLARDKQDTPNLEHTIATISGKPRERGRQYGAQFKDAIHGFLNREIYKSFSDKPNTKDTILRFAAACGKEIRKFSSVIYDEMEGMAEGTGLKLEEIVLITNHEELWHRGVIPAQNHCTVFGASAPHTKDGDTFVCQTWDWMESVYGMSSMLHWKRPEGPSVLAYSYPGLWTGAGLNSAGLALCWHTGGGDGKEPRVGIPAYVLIAAILYSESSKQALETILQAERAGWYVFLIGDAQGGLVTVRGTPKNLQFETDAAANGGRIRPDGDAKVDLERLQANCQKVKVKSTIDAMIFNCAKKEAYVTRRAGGVTPWKKVTF